jgi:hypothetical protein
MKFLNRNVKRKLFNFQQGANIKLMNTLGKPRVIADYMGTASRGLALAGTVASATGNVEIGAPLLTASAVLGGGSQVMKKGISMKRNLRKY